MAASHLGRSGSIDALLQRCRDRGLRLTVQRRAVLEALVRSPDHPTAEEVGSEVEKRLPGVSRTTIYRTLDHLARRGIITRACHPGSTVRYDGRTEVHHHLVCLECDTMIDVADEDLNRIPLPDVSAFDFELRDFRVQLRGLCSRCRPQS